MISKTIKIIDRNDSFSKKSFSQEGEDLIIGSIFEGQPTGFYVDVGAHHPIRYSNTYLLFKRGWRGINIDAMPGTKKLFDKYRPKDINLEMAVSDLENIKEYYQFEESALNGFDKKLSKIRSELTNFKIIDSKLMKTKRLEAIFERYVPNNLNIDLLTIDVEGLDFNVLKSFDILRYKPKVIVIEIFQDIEKAVKSKVYSYLRKRRYKIVAITGRSYIFSYQL